MFGLNFNLMFNLNQKTMGKLNDGIFGGFSGRVGRVVGYNIGGEDMIRKLPRKNPNREVTDKQREQREKFSLVMSYLLPIKEVVGAYFSRRIVAKSRFNLAVGYNLKNAVIQDEDNLFDLDFNKLLISKGDLRGIQDGAVQPQPDQVLQMSWTDNSGQGSAAATDLIVAVVYAPEQDLYHMFNPAPTTRGEGSVALTLPAFFSGQEVHVWATMVSENKRVSANSSYLGQVTVN